MEEIEETICTTCGNVIDSKINYLELRWGDINHKKRAYFCGTDCMQYLLKEIRKKNDWRIRGNL